MISFWETTKPRTLTETGYQGWGPQEGRKVFVYETHDIAIVMSSSSCADTDSVLAGDI